MANRTFICPACGELRRALSPDFEIGTESKTWPRHCGGPMSLLGYRAAQAATTIKPAKRAKWLRLGGWVVKGKGKKPWLPALTKADLADHYPGR